MVVFSCVLVFLAVMQSVDAGLFTNPNMETTFGADNWYCRGCVVENSTDAHQGAYSAKVTGRSKNWHGLTQDVTLTNNTRYKAVVLVKLLNLNSADDLYNWAELMLSCEVDDNQFVKNCMVYIQVQGFNVNYLVDTTNLFVVKDEPFWKKNSINRINKLRKQNIIIKPNNVQPNTYEIEVRIFALKPPQISSEKTSRPNNVQPNTYEIELTQMKHSFPFGSAVGASEMVDSTYKHYQDKVYDLFNWAVIENKLKWRQMEWTQGKINYEDAINALTAMKSNGLKVRGHCVFWSSELRVQDWVKTMNASEVGQAITDRINDVVPRTDGLVKHWDVNNENVHHDFFEQATGNRDITSQMFRDVKAVDKDAQLFLNDYNILQGTDAYALRDQALRLKAQKVPIYGIGIQSHLDANIDIVAIRRNLDIISEAKLPIWITEMSVTESNATRKASAIVDLMTLYFSYPRIQGILLWGFWDGKINNPDNALWEGGNATTAVIPNEAGVAFENLIKNTWMTKETLTIKNNTPRVVRGFRGTYRLRVKQDGLVKATKWFSLGFRNRKVVVNFSTTPIKITVR